MSESDDIEKIREQKAEELKEQAEKEAMDVPEAPIFVESPDQLDDIVSTYDVVIADFYADWCGPCKMLDPILHELTEETDVVVAKVDVDEFQQLAQQRGVQGVPTLFVYANGEQVERFVGVQDKDTLKGVVEQHA